MEEYIGTIKAFGFNFAPRNWASCDGQLLQIAQYTALFSVLGTTYGGDRRGTSALPDLRGRVPMGDGNAPGLTDRRLGEKLGSETNVLSTAQIPAHNHAVVLDGQNINAGVGVPSVNDDGTTDESEGNILANSAGSYAAPTAADTTLSAFNAPVSGTANSANTGGGQAVNNMQPSLGLNYCICLQGLFPPRN